MFHVKKHYAFLLFVLLLNTEIWATEYYVSPRGSDISTGTKSQPWRTLQNAVNMVAPGDTILVLTGTYAGCRIENSGSSNFPITLRAAKSNRVLLNTPGLANKHESILEIETWKGSGTVSDWIIQGFEIAGAPRYGIDIRNTQRILIRKNRVHDSFLTGIFTAFSDDVVIARNRCYKNGEHGIYHSNSGDRPVIRGNRAHNNMRCGIHMNGDKSMGGDGIISKGIIEANIIYKNGRGGGSGINLDGIQDSTIQNNLLYKNHGSGISLYKIDGADGSRRNLILNNTVVMPADGRWALNIPDTSGTDNQAFNNIFYSYNLRRGSILITNPGLVNFKSDHNVVVNRLSVDGGNSVISLTAWQSLGYDSNSFTAPPKRLFKNPQTRDYHLRSNSPAIDVGDSLLPKLPALDFEGDFRIADGDKDGISIVDIGADEYIGPSNAMYFLKLGCMHISPKFPLPLF